MSNILLSSLNKNDYVVFLHKQQLFYHDNVLGDVRAVNNLSPAFISLLKGQKLIEVSEYESGQCYVVDIIQAIEPELLVSLRSVMSRFSDAKNQVINRALQLITWQKQHQYCGQCGKPTQYHNDENALNCELCELFYYPRISPCMMCLIVNGDYCLLAQHEKHRGGFYSTLAGFVEAGETVEQTVHREVHEEVGLNVGELTYFSSQAWPFPHQLMIGYFAQYQFGGIKIDEDEIVDAQWFHYSNLPEVPPADSLSGMMIEAFVTQRKKLAITE
jgi:NAD+ diphosphatase